MTSADTERVVAQLLDECAELIGAGESVSSCLARYPEHAALLEPLLEPVAMLRRYGKATVDRDPAVAAASKARFMAALQPAPLPSPEDLSPQSMGSWWARLWGGLQILRPLPASLATAMVCFLLAGLLATGVVTASAGALPGDPLFGVKLVAQQARLFFAFDPTARHAIGQEIVAERISDADEVLRLHRQVAQVPLAGWLEDFGATEWQVSGLPVLVDSSSTIVGTPVIGALVRGTVSAPGDGSFVAVYLEVESPNGSTEVAQIQPSPDAVLQPDTATPTRWVVVVTNTPRPTRRVPVLVQTATPPERLPTRSSILPTATMVAGHSVTRVAAATATWTAEASTATPAATVPLPTDTPAPALPPPRDETKVQIVHGFVTSIEGDFWTIAGVRTEVDGSTRIVGNPGVGDLVDATLRVRSDGSYLALEIRLVARAEATPEVVEFTGTLQQKNADNWVIGGTVVKIMADTEIVGDPMVGDPVKCRGTRHADGIHALRIEKLALNVVEFSGPIEAISDTSWTVIGHLVYLDSQTRITGAGPRIGRIAEVRAIEAPDNRLLAQYINVLADTPVPPTAKPTQTLTATPRVTAGPTSSATPLPPMEETAVARTPTATRTLTPSPTRTLSPTPSSTPTQPRPSATPTPTELVATKSTRTNTPLPVRSSGSPRAGQSSVPGTPTVQEWPRAEGSRQ